MPAQTSRGRLISSTGSAAGARAARFLDAASEAALPADFLRPEAADFVDLSALEPVLARYRALCAADEAAQEEKR